MNNVRRKALRKVLDSISDVRFMLDEELKSALEELRDEEQEALDNMPENLEGTERYESIENALELLESAYENLDNAVCTLEEAEDNIEEAIA